MSVATRSGLTHFDYRNRVFTESGGGNEVYSENNCSDFGGSPVSGPMSVSPIDIKSGLKPSD